MSDRWLRYRFHADADDPRPVTFPPPGPYWVTGYAGDGSHAVVVAYLRPDDDLRAYWPEAEAEESTEEERITFTDRFPKPDWWTAFMEHRPSPA